MDWLIDNLALFKSVLIGALIGYFTNWLAIKMIFRPRKEQRIGKVRIPFTPGIMVKNQKRLARATADAVTGTLLQKEDLEKVVRSDSMRKAFVDKADEAVFEKNAALSDISFVNENKDVLRDKLSEAISKAVIKELGKIDIASVARSISGSGALSSILDNPIASMLLGGNLYDTVAKGISEYFEKCGAQMLKEKISNMLESVICDPVSSHARAMGIDREKFSDVMGKAYDEIIGKNAGAALSLIDMRMMVEEKISGMDMAQLESLVMSVMRRELKAVVRLGALLGAVIGAVNYLPMGI